MMFAPRASFTGSMSVKHSSSTARRILTANDDQCLSFQGCEDLLRGSRLGGIMAHSGRLLNSSAGSAKTFALSEVVDEIDTFLSHNWVVGRVLKFLALAFEFNFNLAVGLVAVLAVPLAIASFLLKVKNDYILSRLSVAPIFLFALLFVRDVPGLRRCGPVVFMDKSCIAQDDDERKLAGIRKLGAFLVKSKQMLILYSPVYLNKLWTVYELACFLSVHQQERLKVLAVSQAAVYLVCVLVMWVWVSMFAVLRAVTSADLVILNIFGACAAVALLISQRRWARDKAELFQSMATFDVRNCTCAVESDRKVVYKNIAGLMIAVFGLPQDTDTDTALDNFNLIVRTELPSAVAASMGRFAFSYKHYVMLGVTFPGSLLLDLGYCFAQDHLDLECMSYVPLNICWVFFLFPLLLGSVELLSAQFLHWRGWRSGAWVAVATLLATLLASLMNWSFDSWRQAAAATPSAFALFSGGCGGLSLGALLLAGAFGERKRRAHARGDAQRGDLASRRSLRQAPAEPNAEGTTADVEEGEGSAAAAAAGYDHSAAGEALPGLEAAPCPRRLPAAEGETLAPIDVVCGQQVHNSFV